LPHFYGKAVEENGIAILGHPEVEVKEFADGGHLAFTAEVDVRPQFELPDYKGLPVTVDAATLTDGEVDEQLGNLRDRFATLSSADRAAQEGDFVTIDLRAEVDGTEIPDAAATGLSYEIGDDDLVTGLDTALIGMSDGESKTFSTQLKQGEHADKQAEVTVTLRGVRVKQVPDLDDDFAQTASEFDSIDELRGDVRARLERIRKMEQGLQARDRAVEALLERVEVPLPETFVQEEVEWRQQSFVTQLQQAGLTEEQYLEFEGRTREDVDNEIAQGAQQSVKAQFVLDSIAEKEELQVSEAELGEQIVRRASRFGLAPDDYARRLVESGGVGALLAETRRAKALAHVLESATVTDTDGQSVDLDALQETFAPPAEAPAEEPASADSEQG
jgi:trigger factor